MSSVPAASAAALAEGVDLLPLPDVADRLGLPISRVHQLLRERGLLAVRVSGKLVVPADFLDGDAVVKGLGGTITVLNDSGFSPDETLRWLYAADDTLPGRPIDALRGDRGREVKRRAQALAF